MASNLLKIHIQTRATNPPSPFPLPKAFFPSLPFPKHHHHHCHVSFLLPSPPCKSKTLLQTPHCSLSSSSPTPPKSKEEAILQAKTCLSSTLEKPLNNPRLFGKAKKPKQPKFQVEIPIIDDSPSSLLQLAFEVFRDLPIKRKGPPPVKILILWPDSSLAEAAIKSFGAHSSSTQIEHSDITSVSNSNRILNSADVAIFLAPEASDLAAVKAVTEGLYPKPVVIFNPKWGFEEEGGGGFGRLSGFVGSFEVIYSFVGLEVKGILSKRRGVIFKCVRDGVLSCERWSILVEEEDGKLKVVSRFNARPSIGEVENVLYNLMAINSPLTKSAKFLKDLVSNVTGKK